MDQGPFIRECQLQQGNRNSQPIYAVMAILLGMAGFARAADQPNAPEPIFAAVRSAVEEGHFEKTQELGFSLSKDQFVELPRGALLIGVEAGLGQFVNIETVNALRFIYQTDHGEVSFQDHGLFAGQRQVGARVVKSQVRHTVRVCARPGYAVGGIYLRTGLLINGLALTFMRIKGQSLDPYQSYSSEWIGDRTGGSEEYIGRQGAPVVGVFGRENEENVFALGLIYANLPAEARNPPAELARDVKPIERPAATPKEEHPINPPTDVSQKVDEPVAQSIQTNSLQSPAKSGLSWVPIVVFGIVAIPIFLVFWLVSYILKVQTMGGDESPTVRPRRRPARGTARPTSTSIRERSPGLAKKPMADDEEILDVILAEPEDEIPEVILVET